MYTLPDTHPVKNIVEDRSIRDKHWSKLNKKPFIERTREILNYWQLRSDIQVKVAPHPSAPPWNEPNVKLEEDLIRPLTRETSIEEKFVISQETIEQNYREHLTMYTDGSIMEESAAAGLWIPDFQHQEGWKMDHGEARSIMAVELSAIDKALTWVLMHSVILDNKKIAILTDSRAGIAALKKYSPKHHSNLINQIKEKIELLNTEVFEITIQ